jgi:hypothetical protein
MTKALDPDALVRVLGELCAVLRRRGLPIAPPEIIDAARALVVCGLDERATVREALATTLVKRIADRTVFDECFDAFFAHDARAAGDLFERLRADGFDEAEIAALREILAADADTGTLSALLGAGGDAELTRLMLRPDVQRALEGLGSQLQIGFYTQRASEIVGLGRAGGAGGGLGRLRTALKGALGARGEAMAERLAKELERTRGEVRDFVRREMQRRNPGAQTDAKKRRLERTPFTSLSDVEVEEVRRAVRRLAEKLRGKARVRRRHARRGALDLRRTMRLSWKTGGVPTTPARKLRPRDRPKLVLLCDVSDSVRLAARFMLELVWALQELFADTRSFVFVSQLGEVTKLFRREPVGAALGRVFAGEAVSLADNSNYGAVFARFWDEHQALVDRRTTVVVIGDGRNNYQADEAWALAAMKRRARALLWINPERRGSWGIGDSAMHKYAPECTRVLEVACAAELEEAARALIAR